MAAPSYPPPARALAVVGPQFCSPYPVDLTFTKEAPSFTGDDFAVTDINGNVMFRVKSVFLGIRDRRVLLDAAGNPLITMQQKVITAHKRWKVFRGESSDEKDLLFSAKKSHLIQFNFKSKLDVFLAANTKEDACDFKVKGSYFNKSCTAYLGNSNDIVAQMSRQYKVKNIFDDTFGVTIYPNVDYAFVVALVVILEEINRYRRCDGAFLAGG